MYILRILALFSLYDRKKKSGVFTSVEAKDALWNIGKHDRSLSACQRVKCQKILKNIDIDIYV